MTQHQLLAAMMRLMTLVVSIYLIHTGVPRATTSITTYLRIEASNPLLLAELIDKLFLLVVFIFLWIRSSQIATLVLRGGESQATDAKDYTTIYAVQWFGVGASLLGLWTVMNVLPQAVMEMITTLWTLPSINLNMLLRVCSDTLQLIAGTVLLFRWKKLIPYVDL